MAAGNLGSLVVSLGLNAAEFVAGLTQSEYQVRQSMRAIKNDISEVQATIGKVTGALALLSGGALTFAGIVEGIGAIKSAAIESERSILQLDAVLKATGGSAGLTKAALAGIGEDLRKGSTFSDEDIRKAETALLRFRDVRQQTFKDALPQIADLAVAMGVSLPEAAQKLGRALEDPAKGLRGLKQEGVFLDETQILMAKHFSELGDKAAAQKIVMDAVAASTGGAALAATKGLGGATDLLTRAYGELQRETGKKLFGENHEILTSITGLFQDLAKYIKDSTFNLTGFLEKAALIQFGQTGAAVGGTVANALKSTPGIGSNILSAAGSILTGGGTPIYALPDAERNKYFPGDEFVKPKNDRQIAALVQSSLDTLRGSDGRLPSEREAANNAEIAEAKRTAEAKTAADFEGLKSRAEHSATFYALEEATTKASLQAQNSELDYSYSQGLISAAGYYDKKRELATQELDSATKIANQRIALEKQVGSVDNVLTSKADRDASDARLAAITLKASTERAAASEKILGFTRKESEAVNKLADEYANLQAVALDAEGKTGEAAALRFQTANRLKIQALQTDAASNNPFISNPAQIGLQQITDQEKAIKLQGDLTAAVREYDLVLGASNIAQSRIDLLNQTGAITDIDAINAKAASAQKYVTILQQQLAVQEKIASEETGVARDAALLKIEQLKLGIEQLSAASDVLQKKFSDIFSGGFADAVSAVVDRTKTLKAAVLDAGKSIEQQVTRLAAQDIGQSLFGKDGSLGGVSKFFAGIFGGGKGAAGVGAEASVAALGTSATTATGGLTAFVAGLSAATTAAFAFAATGPAGSVANVFSGSDQSGLAGIFGPGGIFGLGAAAGGGMINRPTLVGEQGPELFVPQSLGTIVSNGMLRRMGAAAHTLNISVNVPQGTSRASADQIGLTVARHTQRAVGNIG